MATPTSTLRSRCAPKFVVGALRSRPTTARPKYWLGRAVAPKLKVVSPSSERSSEYAWSSENPSAKPSEERRASAHVNQVYGPAKGAGALSVGRMKSRRNPLAKLNGKGNAKSKACP